MDQMDQRSLGFEDLGFEDLKLGCGNLDRQAAALGVVVSYLCVAFCFSPAFAYLLCLFVYRLCLYIDF